MSKEGENMNTGVYLRKSRAEELSDTTEETLHRHKETLLQFAKEKRLDIVQTYEEVVSGENLYTRPEMLRLLSDVEIGKLDAVLCMDIDRLGRGSMSQQGVILEAFKAANVKIITPRKTYDLNNDLDEEYTEFQTFFARRELKTIKRRMRQGIDRTAQEGGYISNAPYGYEKCRIGKLPSLKIIENEAEFVQLIFDMYVNQNYGCQKIAETLNTMGAVPKRGAKFSRTTVKTIVQNEVYIGKIVYNKNRHRKPDEKNEKHWSTENPEEKWITANGLHEPIIEVDAFKKAQDILLGRWHPPYFKGGLTNPLAGLISCSNCGSKIVRRSFNHGDIIYGLCPTPGCTRMTDFSLMEKAFIASIKNQLAELQIKASTPSKNFDVEALKKSIGNSQKELATIDKQRANLHDLLEQGVYTPAVFLERKSILDEKEKALLKAQALLEQRLENQSSEHLKKICEKVENVLKAYETAGVDEQNSLMKTIVQNSLYFREKEWTNDKFVLEVHLRDI